LIEHNAAITLRQAEIVMKGSISANGDYEWRFSTAAVGEI
jgi:hypothetical protein